MSLKPDTLPFGAPFAIGEAIVQRLQEAFPSPAKVIDNPLRASGLKDGNRIIFFEDQSDRFDSQPGRSAKRIYAFQIGVINRTEQPRQGAHADYRAVKRVIRDCMPNIGQLVQLEGRGVVEGDVIYRLENIDVGGSLILGTFTVDYRDPA